MIWRSLTLGLYFALLTFAAALVTTARAEGGPLSLSVTLPEPSVVDRCPVILTIQVTNTASAPIQERFSPERAEYLKSHCTLTVKSADGKAFLLDWDGGQPDESLYAPVLSISGGGIVRADIVVAPVIRVRTRSRGAEEQFLPIGEYTAYAQVPTLGGLLRSQEFQMSIVPPKQRESSARDRLTIAQYPFLLGKASATSYANFLSGSPPLKGADETVFAQLQTLSRDFPNSPYAQWIRFRSRYYGLLGGDKTHWNERCEAAIRFADENPRFPLSDNLKLKAAERLIDIGSRDRAREVATELLRDYPDSDTTARAKEVDAALVRK